MGYPRWSRMLPRDCSHGKHIPGQRNTRNKCRLPAKKHPDSHAAPLAWLGGTESSLMDLIVYFFFFFFKLESVIKIIPITTN